MEDKQAKTEYTPVPADSVYQTGSTKPPKRRTGIFLAVLGIAIFFSGIATVLDFDNYIELLQDLYPATGTEPNVVAFDHADSQAVAATARQTGLGFCGETVSEFWHTYHQLPRGVFIQSVDTGSDAAQQGVLPGDILVRVNNTPITAIEDLPVLLENAEGPIQIVLHRDGEQVTLQLHQEN